MFASYIKTLSRNNIPPIQDLGDIAGAFPLYFIGSKMPGTFVMIWDESILLEIHKITRAPATSLQKGYARIFRSAIEKSPFEIVRELKDGYELAYRGPSPNIQNLSISEINEINENVPGNVMRMVMANIHGSKSRRASRRTRRTRRARRT